MRINKLDLAKTISDFLFLWIENPEEKAKKLFELKHTLDDRGHGFEKYIQYYFQNAHNYKVKLNWRTNSQDDWIDLKWIKKINWVENYLLVQCKKYNVKDITYNDVSHFYWKIVDIKNKYKENILIYYITTTKFTKKAKDFLDEKGIISIDFEKISKLQEYYPLEKFREQLLKNEWEKEVFSSFNNEQVVINLDNDIIDTIDATDKEVIQLLKQVRRDLSYSKQLRLWDIVRNDTIELLARKRPHNLKALKEVTNSLSLRERKKIDKYWQYFIERLKYLNHEEIKLKDIKNDTFLKKILNFF